MDTNKKHTAIKIILIVTGVLVAGGVVLYIINASKKPTVITDNNQVAVALIGNAKSGLTASDQANLITFDNGYLNAWLQGLNSGSSMFYYNGKSYYTQGGTAVK